MKGYSWPSTDSQIPRLIVHYAHIANIRRADSTVSNAVGADIWPDALTSPLWPNVSSRQAPRHDVGGSAQRRHGQAHALN